MCAAQSNVIAFIGPTLRHARLASMQSGENGSLAQVNRRSRERKGLEAIFTSQKEGMKIEILTGAAGIMAGLFLSVLALFRADAPQALGPWGDTI